MGLDFKNVFNDKCLKPDFDWFGFHAFLNLIKLNNVEGRVNIFKNFL